MCLLRIYLYLTAHYPIMIGMPENSNYNINSEDRSVCHCVTRLSLIFIFLIYRRPIAIYYFNIVCEALKDIVLICYFSLSVQWEFWITYIAIASIAVVRETCWRGKEGDGIRERVEKKVKM